jgi:uncharacterized protein (TIGR04255 family)
MRWIPAHKDHAIERVAASFRFAEGVPSKPWQTMLAAATVSFQQLGFNSTSDVPVGFGQPIPGMQILTTPGRIFRVITGNEVHEEVTLAPSGLVYSTVLYDSWGRYRDRALELLAPPLDRALQVVNLGSLKLEYWDRFVFDGPPEEADYSELLQSESQHLPSFSFRTNRLWHSHVGYFVQPGSSQSRLINLNVDVLDLIDAQPKSTDTSPVTRRSVGIYSMAQDSIEESHSPSNAVGTTSTVDEMHAILKQVLADVISDKAAQRISLGPGGSP